MLSFIQELARLLAGGTGVVLATVVDQTGSTPRSRGARMAVLPDSGILGSVGGGLLEASVTRLAPELFAAGGARLCQFALNGGEIASLDMTCGGKTSILLEYLPAGPDQGALYAGLARELAQGRACVLETGFDGPDERLRILSKRLLPDRAPPGGGLRFQVPAALIRHGHGLRLVESFEPPYALYLAGAGHVALFTARLAALAGFRVIVLDDRPEFASRERFPEAHEVRLLDSFAACLPPDLSPTDFVAVVTRGHAHDRAVLAQALKTRAGYVGMIGSRAKRTAAYAALLAEGFTQADLDRVHCPIGLAIGAQTPEEIAVSIAAELIAARAGSPRPGAGA